MGPFFGDRTVERQDWCRRSPTAGGRGQAMPAGRNGQPCCGSWSPVHILGNQGDCPPISGRRVWRAAGRVVHGRGSRTTAARHAAAGVRDMGREPPLPPERPDVVWPAWPIVNAPFATTRGVSWRPVIRRDTTPVVRPVARSTVIGCSGWWIRGWLCCSRRTGRFNLHRSRAWVSTSPSGSARTYPRISNPAAATWPSISNASTNPTRPMTWSSPCMCWSMSMTGRRWRRFTGSWRPEAG